jgi:hypothetical protein
MICDRGAGRPLLGAKDGGLVLRAPPGGDTGMGGMWVNFPISRQCEILIAESALIESAEPEIDCFLEVWGI